MKNICGYRSRRKDGKYADKENHIDLQGVQDVDFYGHAIRKAYVDKQRVRILSRIYSWEFINQKKGAMSVECTNLSDQ